MNVFMRHFAVFACVVAWASQPGAAQAEDEAVPEGVEWATTSQVTMEGMPFSPPPTRVKVCVPADATEPPGSANDEHGCVNSDFMQDGLKVTWNSVCSGPPEMTGQGELTYDDSQTSYTGALNYTTDEGAVTIQLTGERIGTCDRPR